MINELRKWFFLPFLIITLTAATTTQISAAPSDNPVFATIQVVKRMLSNALSPIITQLSQHDTRISELENRVEILERLLTPTLPPLTPTPESLLIHGTWNTPIYLPSGYKSMNIEVSSNQGVGDWAPGPSFDGGLTFWEQIRFTCGTNKCNVNIPILSSKYFFHSGGGTNPDATDINLTLFPESNSKVLVLGQTVNYPFTSSPFDTTGFNYITITAGGGDNPQNLVALDLEKEVAGTYTLVSRIVCDQGAKCPIDTLPITAGIFRVSIVGNGTKANLGAILKP